MRVSPKARPLDSAELAELRDLKRELRGLLGPARRVLGPFVPASEAARLLGFRNVRTVLDLVRAGFFPGAWKPAANRLHLPLGEIEAYIAARRVSAPSEGAARG